MHGPYGHNGSIEACTKFLASQDSSKPTDSKQLEELLLSVLYEYENFYKIGYDDGRDGKEKDWALATGLAQKHARVVVKRLQERDQQRLSAGSATLVQIEEFSRLSAISKRAALDAMKKHNGNAEET